MTQIRRQSEKEGRKAEWLACLYLRLTGWSILGQRVKTRVGEVDIIARRGSTVCFVEVKWRSSLSGLNQAIDAKRLERVARAANVLIPRYAMGAETVRIDVILMAPKQWPQRIVNAWQPMT